jgi:putative membrane protein
MTRSLLLASSFLAALALSSVPALADGPREFLYQAQQGSNSEIMLGRLAAERARSPRVRAFGQTLVNDHRQARQEVRDLGARFGVRPNRDPAAEALQERDRLSSMRGRAFDREFIRFMIDDHRRDIAEFRDEAREGHGPVSDLARRQLPTLRKHLDMAMALQNNNGRFAGNFDQVGDPGWRDRDANGWVRDNDRDNDRDRDTYRDRNSR